jgi:uncharacterized UBP type Zn finger protein
MRQILTPIGSPEEFIGPEHVETVKQYVLRLVNTGANCYINVVVQAVLFCGPILHEAISAHAQSDPRNIHFIINALILASFNPNSVRSTNQLQQCLADYPLDLKQHKFTDGSQQDAFECWLDLYDRLESEIKDLFKLIQMTTVECTSCYRK